MNIKRIFGSALKESRKNLGISQTELAGRASLHRTYVSDVERGYRNPSLETIVRLAGALHVPCSAMFPLELEKLDGNSLEAKPERVFAEKM